MCIERNSSLLFIGEDELNNGIKKGKEFPPATKQFWQWVDGNNGTVALHSGEAKWLSGAVLFLLAH